MDAVPYRFHPKQLRHLVKKERRRVWVVYQNGMIARSYSNPDRAMAEFPNWEIVEMVEVRKKK